MSELEDLRQQLAEERAARLGAERRALVAEAMAAVGRQSFQFAHATRFLGKPWDPREFRSNVRYLLTWARGQHPVAGDDQVDRVKLRRILGAYFSDGDLRDICFELGISYESLPPGGKSDKARELVVYCENHRRLADLMRAAFNLNPNAPWS